MVRLHHPARSCQKAQSYRSAKLCGRHDGKGNIVTKNVVATPAIPTPVNPTLAIDESPVHVGPPRPHAAFGRATHQPASELSAATAVAASTARQLSHLQRRSRDVLSHKLIVSPAASSLRRLGQMLLANIRQIQDLERRTVDSDAARDRALPLIQERIQSSHRLLDVIVAQIGLCDSTAREALAVADCGRRLTQLEPVKHYKLLPLFDRVCDEIRRTPQLPQLLPMPGVHLTSVIESQTGQADAANFVGGILTARVLVWLLGDGRFPTQNLARLALAALLQDVGRLPVVPGGASERVLRGRRADWLEQEHPAVGAALFGSIRGAPVELPMLVAQHHEQLDGGGFPSALRARDILPDAAILATAARFVELCQMPSPATTMGDPADAKVSALHTGKTALVRAAELLQAEAEWGKWPLEFASSLVQTVIEADAAGDWQKFEMPGDANVSQSSLPVSPAGGNVTIDRNLQVHDQETALQGMHADSAQRALEISIPGGAWADRFRNDAGVS